MSCKQNIGLLMNEGRCTPLSVLITKIQKNISPKRVLKLVLFHKSRQQSASMTVEASLVVSIFFFFFYLLWKCFLLLLLQLSVAREVITVCKEYGVYGYMERRVQGEEAEAMEWLYAAPVWNALPETDLVERWYVTCDSDETLRVQITITYDFLCEAPLMPSFRLPLKQTFQFYPYLGVYDADRLEEPKAVEDVVYVTKTGTVYHESRSCTYLRMSIHRITRAELETARNDSGGKYTECSLCKTKQQSETLYITNTGTKYHHSLQCSSLSRDVRTMKRSEAEGMRVCSKCGGSAISNEEE